MIYLCADSHWHGAGVGWQVAAAACAARAHDGGGDRAAGDARSHSAAQG